MVGFSMAHSPGTDTFFIGTHLSSAKGMLRMGQDALAIGANTLQCFIRNPRGFSAKAFDQDDFAALHALLVEHAFGKVVIHAPYILNPCSPDPHVREIAAEIFAEDLRRLQSLPGNLYVFHPGSHVGQDMNTAVALIAELLNRVLTPDLSTTVLLETMSGRGTEVGKRFEELRAILEQLNPAVDVGVCLDSCHLYAAGYDIVNDLDGVLQVFDEVIGLQRLRAIHLNDSLAPFASHKDRHAALGEGCIGLAALLAIINHPALRHLPFITETPVSLEAHKGEIQLLREHRHSI